MLRKRAALEQSPQGGTAAPSALPPQPERRGLSRRSLMKFSWEIAGQGALNHILVTGMMVEPLAPANAKGIETNSMPALR